MKSLLVILLMFLSFGTANAQQGDWTGVEKVFGKKGSVQDGVLKITFPRSDLKVKIGDFNIAPGLALTSWIGFIRSDDHGMGMNDQAMMMGDLVLLDQEVGKVVVQIISENLEVTALHNHLLNETPTIKYLHFSGKGDPVKLAQSIKAVIAQTATPLVAAPPPARTTPLDWSKVMKILGNSGKQNGSLLQYGFARNEKLTEDGMEMPPYIGMATAINFQMEGNRAAITGDFVLLAGEVNPVFQALTANGIAVTAIHNHMLLDEPRLFMMHYWAVGDPEKLAAGLRAALEKTNSKGLP